MPSTTIEFRRESVEYSYDWRYYEWVCRQRGKFNGESLCGDGIGRLWSIPKEANRIWLTASDRKTKDAYLCRMSFVIEVDGTDEAAILFTDGFKALEKRFPGRQFYLTCEYE